jgi:hypothetical protein
MKIQQNVFRNFRLNCMMFILTAFLVAIIFVFTACNSKVSENGTETSILPESYLLYTDFPSKNVIPRNVEIWLPENYAKLEALPVLYMADGQNMFHGQRGWEGGYSDGWQIDESLDSLNKTGAVPEVRG